MIKITPSVGKKGRSCKEIKQESFFDLIFCAYLCYYIILFFSDMLSTERTESKTIDFNALKEKPENQAFFLDLNRQKDNLDHPLVSFLIHGLRNNTVIQAIDNCYPLTDKSDDEIHFLAGGIANVICYNPAYDRTTILYYVTKSLEVLKVSHKNLTRKVDDIRRATNESSENIV